MAAERDKLDRRTLLVLGAASVIPACAAGGADSEEWDPSMGGGLGGGTSTNSGSTSTSTAGGQTSTSGGTSTSSTSSNGHTSSSSTSTSSTSSNGNTSTSSTSSSGGPTCTTGSNSKVLSFSSYPALMSSGGSASFQGSGYSDPNCGQPDIIVLNKSGTYIAFSASCSHQCCVVKVSGSNFRCPCHGAQFSTTTGACTNGVAPSPLATLQVCADSTGVTVTW